jgi:uncharacterized protein YdeI (YjbR/CyaY-like superfamily)
MMDSEPMHRFVTREEWRQWLHENHDKETGIWFVFPLKASGERTVSYNDAVEEALCYGWIDSTIRSYDEMHKIQRFTPRNPKSTYSQSNKERLRWLADRGMIHPDVLRNVARILNEEFVFPEDILEAVREDEKAWEHFQKFSEPYKRIRIAFIDSARENDEEFMKRLNNFMKWTRKGKLVPGYGGIDKYY